MPRLRKKPVARQKVSSLHQLTVGLLVVALIVLMRLGRHALLPMGVLLFLALASAVYGYRHPRGRTLGRWLVYEKRGGLAKMLQLEDELYRLSAKVTTTKPVPDQSETRKSETEPEQITPVPDQHPETVSDEEMTGFFTAYLAARRERKDVSQHYDDFLTVARYYRFSIPKQVDGKLAIYYYADQDYLPLYIAPTEAMAPFGTRQVTGQQALALVAQLDVVGVQIRANNQRIMLPNDILQKRWGEEA
ncbi:hypothetical protein [Weissella cibaria]|uniref:hypothetical protein n=1 Tax=Weissella cibaria TaxID=137591 RepID=UPI0036D8576E